MSEAIKNCLFGLWVLVVVASMILALMYGKVEAQMVKKPAVDVKEVQSAEKDQTEGKASTNEGTYGFMFPLDPFIVNLAAKEGSRFLKVNVSLKMSSPEVHHELRKNILKLRDSILFLLSSKSFDDIDSFQEKSKLEKEIMVRANKFLTSGQVNRVYFTEFIVQ